MQNVVLNVTEVFQLAALWPCVFIVGYLFLSVPKKSDKVVPIFYFISLTCTFLFPILSFFPEIDKDFLRIAHIFNDDLEPVLGFLLILQFILRRHPPFVYWLVFLLPFVGGGPLLYLSVSQSEICFASCFPSESLLVLYRVIGASLIFMLLIVILRKHPKLSRKDETRRHKYWLIIMMILYNVLLLGIDLSIISEHTKLDDAVFVKTMIGVTFVYLVFSSIFRVFNKNFNVRPVDKIIFSDRDRDLVNKIKSILKTEKPYMDLGFNRGILADKLGVTEQHLSRIINSDFKKSFSELMNEYRIIDAKAFLRESENPVTTISFDVGFSSITSFNRVFKETTGISPSNYREQSKKV